MRGCFDRLDHQAKTLLKVLALLAVLGFLYIDPGLAISSVFALLFLLVPLGILLPFVFPIAFLAGAFFGRDMSPPDRIIVSLLGFIGASSFFLPIYVHYLDNLGYLHNVELAPRGMESFAIDGEGYIYVSSSTFRRIQKYDPSGRFQLSWRISTGGRDNHPFSVHANSLGQIEVRSKGGADHVFDRYGREIQEKTTGAYQQVIVLTSEDEGGTKVYAAHNVDYMPEIVLTRLDQDGLVRSVSSVVTSPWYFAYIPGIILGWCIMVIGGVWAAATRQRRESYFAPR